MRTNARTRANHARRAAAADAACRPGDMYRFSMTAAEVVAAAAGRLPARIQRACFAAAPLVVAGDHTEYMRRLDADRELALAALLEAARARPAALTNPERLWSLVRHQRTALYAAGLITVDECNALLDDEVSA